jgi:hypothetical protein
MSRALEELGSGTRKYKSQLHSRTGQEDGRSNVVSQLYEVSQNCDILFQYMTAGASRKEDGMHLIYQNHRDGLQDQQTKVQPYRLCLSC